MSLSVLCHSSGNSRAKNWLALFYLRGLIVVMRFKSKMRFNSNNGFNHTSSSNCYISQFPLTWKHPEYVHLGLKWTQPLVCSARPGCTSPIFWLLWAKHRSKAWNPPDKNKRRFQVSLLSVKPQLLEAFCCQQGLMKALQQETPVPDNHFHH